MAKRKTNMETRLRHFFENAPQRAYSVHRVAKEMGLTGGKGRHELERAFLELHERGLLQPSGREGKFRLAGTRDLVVGTLTGHPSGFAFLIREDGKTPDVFIPKRLMRGFFHGDKVEAIVESALDDPRPFGSVSRLISRGKTRLAGRFQANGSFGSITLDNPRYGFDVSVSKGKRGKALNGDIVVVEILDWPDGRHEEGRGQIVEVLGREGDPHVDEKLVLEKYGLEEDFPEAALRAAESIPSKVGLGEKDDREDLTDIPLVTIDGETAKDFDDAVCVLPEEGGWRLIVAIADVSHYVRPGSALDDEAFARSTSVYFPGRVIPMLPQALSNGICSLNPNVLRLAMVADLHFDAEGREKKPKRKFYRAIFKSRHRLTYDQVFELLENPNAATEENEREILSRVAPMRELARKIRARRIDRGALDFDLPEAEILLNEEGFVEGIRRTARNEAHQIIEDFMIAANEAVGEYLTQANRPCLYRIHEPPNEVGLGNFEAFLVTLGLKLGKRKGSIEPVEYQRLSRRIEEHPEKSHIHMMMLRSMMQARYSESNAGHFGLASSCYLHFTSPIRRYPDLIVHRILGMMIDRAAHRDFGEMGGQMKVAAEHTSNRERNAVLAEREYENLKKAHFMARHLGNEYSGRIAGVTGFGLFVELDELFVEGLIPIESLTDDHYRFDPTAHTLTGRAGRRVYRLGMPIRIRVDGVDIPSRRVMFSPAEETSVQPGLKQAKKKAPTGKRKS